MFFLGLVGMFGLCRLCSCVSNLCHAIVLQALLSLDHLPAGNALLGGIDNSVDGIFGALLDGIGDLLSFLGSFFDVNGEWLLVLPDLLAGNSSEVGIADVGGLLLLLGGFVDFLDL